MMGFVVNNCGKSLSLPFHRENEALQDACGFRTIPRGFYKRSDLKGVKFWNSILAYPLKI